MSRSQPRLTINDQLFVDIYPAFQLDGYWPKSGRRHFLCQRGRQENKRKLQIDLLSKETGSTQPYSTDRDAWQMDFASMDRQITGLENRGICFEAIKRIISIRFSPMNPISDPVVIKTVFMYICEKEMNEISWTNERFPERINSFLLQLVASLQNKCLPHFYLSNVNLLRNRSPKAMRAALREAWKLARDFCTNTKFFEEQLH